MINEALAYAEAGIPVFPLHTPEQGWADGDYGYFYCSCGNPACSNIGKHPRTNRGLKDATVDSDLIRAWFTKWPDANIGIPTGPPSGLLVVDCDGPEAQAWVTEKPDLFPITAVASSGKGLHLYYFYPEQARIPNSVKKVHPEVDVRGDGGYVVAPPSLHRTGNRYVWKGRSILDDLPPDELPPDTVELLKHSRASAELAAVPDKIPAGQRNTTFTSMAGKMRRAGLSPREILAMLLQANQDRCVEPLPRHELEHIAQSVGRYQPAPVEEALSDSGEIKLYDRDALDSIPPPKWLIRGILTKDSLSVIFGQANVGKTFAAIDMALSVATGLPFQFDEWQVEEPGYVLYVAAEGAYGIGPRVRAWEKHNGVRANKLYVVPRAVQLLQKDEQAKFMDVLNQTFGYPKLVVIDTLARCMVGGDENAAQDMGRMVAAGDAIRKETEGANVLFVHHSGKDGQYERGSTALRGAVDTMIQMDRESDEKGTPVRFLCRKQKDFELFDPRWFVLNKVQYGQGPDEHSVVLEESEFVPDEEKGDPATIVAPGQDRIL